MTNLDVIHKRKIISNLEFPNGKDSTLCGEEGYRIFLRNKVTCTECKKLMDLTSYESIDIKE